jgi:ATP-binding cassette, subfamily B, bacterial MsbA
VSRVSGAYPLQLPFATADPCDRLAMSLPTLLSITLMRRFLPYFKLFRPVRKHLILAILAGLVYGAANGAGLPLMAKQVFPKIFGEGAAPLGTWELVGIALWLPGVFIIRGLAGYANSYLIQYVGVRVLESLRLQYFEKLQRLPLAFFKRNSTGDLIARGLGDTGQLQHTLVVISNEIIKQPATLVGAIGYLIYLAFTEQGVMMVLASLAIIPTTVFPIRYVGRKMVEKAKALQAQAGSITDRFTENLSAVKEVRAFGLEQMETNRFNDLTRAIVKTQMKVVKYAQSLAPAIEIISAIGISITFVYAYRARVPLESFLAIIFALAVSYDPVKKLGALSNELKRGEVSLERIEQVLYEDVSIQDPETPVAVDRLDGNISFNDVRFAYVPGEPVLRDISIRIPAGTVCALVGPSGAGKTTFANLVPRFYDVAAGSVTIDGVDVRQMRVADLRRNIAIVSQEPVLFNDTIYNNLLFGRMGATREEVEKAAKDAFAHEFILSLPQGYDTMTGERGSNLSGGQKQRIALARAFLRQAPILVLDEATSALDSDSEAFVQKALRKLMVGRTVLIIAHRFSTIRDASMILVFQNARIVAHGSHATLYESNALYRSLYDRQQSAA